MKNLILLLFPLFLLLSCGKDLETVTVRSDPSEMFNQADSVFAETDTTDEDDFVHIKLGEISAIESLDPLFASSNSEWRIISLIYDGLVELGKDGKPATKLAKRWEVNSDSTQFTFHLKTIVHFHNSPVFESGNGRRFTARDVRFAFERMASDKVPDFAARKFMDIRGFSAYHHEQNYVKDPAKRVLESIEGIRVRNDSTITFHLNKKAGDFLQRLAHPMASIYARESVQANGKPITQAAGTGSFRFIRKEGNTHLLTSLTNSKNGVSRINRLDIISGLAEKDLFQEFARNNLDALLELGPATLISVADSTGKLLEHFYKTYRLRRAQAETSYSIYYNTNSGQHRQVNEFISNLNEANLLENAALGSISTNRVDTISTQNNEKRQLVITHTEHPFHLFLLNRIASDATKNDFSFSMNGSYAIWNEIALSLYPYTESREFLQWTTPVYILQHNSISGIEINNQPWNLDLSGIKKSGGN